MNREAWNKRHAEPSVRHWATETNDNLDGEVAHLPPGRALDLACGQGQNAVWLAERGWQVTAVDFSAAALAKAREKSSKVEWVEADLTEYEPEAGAYDLVTVLFLQLPSAERRVVLARAAAALAAGGLVLVVGHDKRNEGHGPRDPDVLYTPEEIVSELPGLVIQRAETVRRGDSLDALVRASRAARAEGQAS